MPVLIVQSAMEDRTREDATQYVVCSAAASVALPLLGCACAPVAHVDHLPLRCDIGIDSGNAQAGYPTCGHPAAAT
jgi:hypothetical protein